MEKTIKKMPDGTEKTFVRLSDEELKERIEKTRRIREMKKKQ